MPFHQLPTLLGDQEHLMKMARQLVTLNRGMVIATGQATSGKLTTLMALADHIAAETRPVHVITTHEQSIAVFVPLPKNWTVTVQANRLEQAALFADAATGDAIVLTDLLTVDNAKSAAAAAGKNLILACVDTPLIGLDVAYALRDMKLDYGTVIDMVRCIWSQALVPALCEQCSEPVSLSKEESTYLFPLGNEFANLKREVGCEKCEWSGNSGRMALCDVTFIDELNRRNVSSFLMNQTRLILDEDHHISMTGEARLYLNNGSLGVGTYRDLILRNPLLRSENILERERARSTKLAALFDKFVSPAVKQRLLDDDESTDNIIKGESRVVTCLFCDIRDFTPRAESRDPHQLFAELNRYFADVVDAVLTNEGTIDKFIGDAVMAVFGAPLDQIDHAERAVNCALTIQQRIENLNKSYCSDLPIQVGIGVNTGTAIAGCLGTDERMEYTVLGDAINVAARLESQATPGQILISDSTRRKIAGGFKLKSIGPMDLKGKSKAIDVFEVLGKA
jgi:class 3 adenylate cyclase